MFVLPGADLAAAVAHKAFQIRDQIPVYQHDGEMGAGFVGGPDQGDLSIARVVVQLHDQIEGEEGRIAGRGEQPLMLGRAGGGQESGERTRVFRQRVRYHRVAETGIGDQVAVRVDQDFRGVVFQPLRDPAGQGAVREFQQSLVLASEAARHAARQHDGGR